MTQQKKSRTTQVVTERRVKFAAVGAANTAVDFIIFNILATVLGFSPILANIASTGVAMTQSFLLNKFFVFKSHGGNRWQQGTLFLLVTVTAMWGVQTFVIWALHVPAEWLAGQFIASPDLANVIALNGTKVIATIASMIWNYIFYRSLVFGKAAK